MKQKFHFIKKRNTKRLYHWKLTNMWKHWCLLQVKSSTQLMKLGRSQKTKRKALINGTDKRGIKDSWFCSDDWLCPITRRQFASSKQGIQGKLYDWASRIASCNTPPQTWCRQAHVLDYAWSFGNTIKGLKPTTVWSTYYFTNKKSYYPIPTNLLKILGYSFTATIESGTQPQTVIRVMMNWQDKTCLFWEPLSKDAISASIRSMAYNCFYL